MAITTEHQDAYIHESLRFELKRIKILLGLFGLITFMSILTLLFARDQLLVYFSAIHNYFFVVANSAVFMIFLMGRYAWVNDARRKHRSLPEGYPYLSAFTEISVPTVALVTLLYAEQNSTVIDSPAFTVYFLFLISSVFYLNPKVSVLSGIIAGASYSTIIAYAHTSQQDFPEVAYHARSMLIVLGGMVAAAVAMEIKQRIQLAITTAAEYKRVESLFNQQVSPEVVNALKEKQHVIRQIEVTIMFLDIRGFTNIVAQMSPEEINLFQNAVLGPLIEIINRHHGVVNQLLGDGLMASFGTPLERTDHSLLALRAAQAIFDHLDTTSGHLKVKVGIGMHTGPVVTGNIGTAQRQQYSISGTAVIVAARLEQLNKQYQSSWLVSGAFYKAARAEIASHQKLGQISIKGISTPVEVIQLR